MQYLQRSINTLLDIAEMPQLQVDGVRVRAEVSATALISCACSKKHNVKMHWHAAGRQVLAAAYLQSCPDLCNSWHAVLAGACELHRAAGAAPAALPVRLLHC